MATYTTNYNLDKYEGTDSPNLTDQYNSAMDKIDAQMMTNAQSAQTAQTAAGNAQTTAQAAQAAAATAQSAATAASTAAGEAQTAATNAQSAADNAASQAAAKAPISHASSALTYGGGTSTNYGHVKLVDTVAGGEGAANSVAATPAAVNAALNGDIVTSGQINLVNANVGDWMRVDAVGARELTIRYNKALNLYNLYLRCQGEILSSSQNQYLVDAGTIPANLRPSSDRTIDGAITIIGAKSGQLTNYSTEDVILTADGGIKLPVKIGNVGSYVVVSIGQLTLFANDWGVTG